MSPGDRSISLLPSLPKVLKKIKSCLLIIFEQQILYDYQRGFRKKVQHFACPTGCYIENL